MEEEMKDTLINMEKEQEIQFTLSFKLILAISIGLTGILSLGGIIFFITDISNQIWIMDGMNDFLHRSLFFISVFLCFIALVNIAVIKKPFSKILVWSTMAIGILFVMSSVIFPHIAGYNFSIHILSTGKFTLIDGTIFIIGLLGILFSKVIQYGFMYQRNTDMTV